LDALPLGAINMHPSLIPRHRGAAPIYHTLLQGDEVTGVTVLEIHRQRFDAGRVLSQITVPVDPLVTYEPLARQLAALGAEQVIKALASYDDLLRHAVPQDERLATNAPKIDGSMAQVCWEKHQPRHIHNMWRAFGHSLGLHSHFRDKRIKLLTVEPPYSALYSHRKAPPTKLFVPSVETVEAGRVEYDPKRSLLWVKCAVPLGVASSAPSDDTDAADCLKREAEGWIGVREVQMEGKRAMDALAFRNGFIAPARTAHNPVRFITVPFERIAAQ